MDKKKESIILSVILFCLILIAVGMSYAFLKTSFFGAKTSVLKVGSLSLVLDETSGNAITVEDGTPMYDSEGVKQDNYFTFALKNNGVIDSAYTIYLEDQPLDNGDIRVGQSYVHYNLEKDSSVLPAKALEGDQVIDKGIIKKNQTINYKMRLWFASDIPQSEENKVFKAKLNIVGNQNTKMMAGNLGLTNDERKSVTKIVFQDSIKSIDNESKAWDTSAAKNKTVMARMVPNTDYATTNTLYIHSNGEIFANYNCGTLFGNLGNLKSIENINLLNTSNVTDMNSMFIWDTSLESINLSNFDTSNVTKMALMFYRCSSLTTLDVSRFDTSKVTNMSNMFGGCSSLTNLDVSRFNTSNVTNMSSMFYGCKSLTELNASSFDTSKVTTMTGMFQSCSNLIKLDVSNFNTSKVTDMNSMFKDCSNLSTLNINNFDTSNVTNMNAMFHDCSNLINLDVSSFDTKNVTDMGSMFRGCGSLTSLNVSNFNTSNVTNMHSMFHQCYKLQSINLENFDTSNVTDMTYMFYLDQVLTYINLKGADFSKVTSYGEMFSYVPSSIKIVAKDATAKTWLEDKLSGKGTVTIA